MTSYEERTKDYAFKIDSFRVKQKQDYEFKKQYAHIRIREFIQECDKRGLNTHVSVGGLDSITLYLFIKSLGYSVPGVTVSSLEDKSIQNIHKALGLTILKPYKNKSQVLQEFGFPVLSKEIASKIELLQNPSDKNKTVRHAIITGETGEYGGYRKNTRMKMSQKWLNLFGGYENETEEVNYKIPDFKVSSKCCYYLKEKPADDWAKENNSVPFLGLMASEGGRREKSLMINGCNYFGKSTIRSAPFAIFNRQDILQLALEMNQCYLENTPQFEKLYYKQPYSTDEDGNTIPYESLGTVIPKIYGNIDVNEDGKLYTTRAQRTGCSMCGFGIQLEKRPHRFDMLRVDNPKEWEYWMFNCCTDDNGNKYGWGKVLDYIGIGWR